VIHAEPSCDLARHNGNLGAASAPRSAAGFARDISRGSPVARELVSADPELDRGQRVCATGASDFASVDRKASRPKGETTDRREVASLAPYLLSGSRPRFTTNCPRWATGFCARDARLTLARQSCRENGGLGSLQRFVAVVKPRRLALLYRGARSAWAGRRSPIRLTFTWRSRELRASATIAERADAQAAVPPRSVAEQEFAHFPNGQRFIHDEHVVVRVL
jgi:hypothetical protein